MGIREVPTYALDAVDGGCFVNGGNSVKVRDRETGKLRPERVFTFDRRIERSMYNKRLQMGERAAMELADKLGWVSPWAAEALQTSIHELEAALQEAEARASEASAAADHAVKRLGVVIEQKDTAEESVAELRKAVARLNGEKGQLTKQLNKVTKDKQEFGDD